MEANTGEERMEQIELYLSGKLSDRERTTFERLLQTDSALAREVENVKITRSLIRNYGLREELKNIHAKVMAEGREEASTIPLSSYVMRIAAGLLLLLVSVFVLQLATVSGERVFTSNFNTYPVEMNRGEGNTSKIKSLYSEGNYQDVINTYEQKTSPSPSVEEAFLAGNAFLALSQPQPAIDAFQKIVQPNHTNTTQYQEEAEYYLGLAYLQDKQAEKAAQVFKAIRNNPAHLYHDKVDNWWFTWKMQLLQWKE